MHSSGSEGEARAIFTEGDDSVSQSDRLPGRTVLEKAKAVLTEAGTGIVGVSRKVCPLMVTVLLGMAGPETGMAEGLVDCCGSAVATLAEAFVWVLPLPTVLGQPLLLALC